MVRQLFILLIAFYWTGAFGQIKIITKQPQKVPQGKKWILTSTMEPLIEVNEGTLNSGTLCNAKIMSNPKSVNAIIEGDYDRPNKAYEINFTSLSKVVYTNDLTYKISAIRSFLCYDYYEINQDKSSSESSTITFYQGQIVYAMGCLESIQIRETALSQNELIEIKSKETLKKQKEIKEQQRQISVEKNRKENKIIGKLTDGTPFDEFEIPTISNNVSPLIQCKNTIGLKSFIVNCLFDSKDNVSIIYNITYDTNSNPIKVTKTITTKNQYDGTENGSKTVSNFNCSEEEVIKNIRRYYQLSEPSRILYKGKMAKVSIVKHIWIKSQSKYYLTKQNVEIKKRKGSLNIEMRNANSFSGHEENEIERNAFTDISYISKIREYIISDPPNTAGYHYGINYYARRTDYKINIEYNDDEKMKEQFTNTIWKIYRE
jgi:hypothetical protein